MFNTWNSESCTQPILFFENLFIKWCLVLPIEHFVYVTTTETIVHIYIYIYYININICKYINIYKLYKFIEMHVGCKKHLFEIIKEYIKNTKCKNM